MIFRSPLETFEVPAVVRRKWSPALLFSALVLLALVLAGCPMRYPAPQDQVTDADELLGLVRGASNSVTDARLKNVELDYFGEEGRVSLRQTLLWKQPDKIRAQTYIPGFDGVAGVLVCACKRFAFHDRQEDVYYYGPATPENVARVLPLGLSCQDIGHALLGGAPHQRIDKGEGTKSLEWDEDTGRYKVVILPKQGEDAGSRLELQVTHKNWRIAQMKVVSPSGQVVYTYDARDFRAVGNQDLQVPRARRFVVASSGDDFSLITDETQLDPGLDDVLFEFAPPGGTRLRYIGPESSPPPPPEGGNLCLP